MAKKALLMILDGWGIGRHGKGDVIYNTPTPYLDYLQAVSSTSQLQASGENVGLPDGQMGNSEVGHLNIGAGRVVYQDLVKINKACADGSIAQNPQVVEAYQYAKRNGKKLHLMGLTSNGGVHSSLDHLFKLIEVGKEFGLSQQLFVHCFMDGRDTDPKSGKGFIEALQAKCRENDANIASIVGRFYAMDRDKRWNRVKEAYDLIVSGTGKKAADMVQAMQESYDEGVTDEFVKPITNASVDGTIGEGDVVIFINFRNDRAKELTQVLTQQDMPEEGMHTILQGRRHTLPQGECHQHPRRIPLTAGQEAAPHSRDREVRTRHLLLQRRQGGTLRGRRPHTRGIAKGSNLRPQARDVSLRGERQARRGNQDRAVRLHRGELRQW